MRITIILGAATICLATGPALAQDDKDKEAAFKVLAGADVDATEASPVALGPWAGGPAGSMVVAALEDTDGDDSSDTLGTLRVGLVTRHGTDFALIASDENSKHPELSRSYLPSVPDVMIDRAVFHISPDEVALGVDVTETLITTSTCRFRADGARRTDLMAPAIPI